MKPVVGQTYQTTSGYDFKIMKQDTLGNFIGANTTRPLITWTFDKTGRPLHAKTNVHLLVKKVRA